MSSFTREKSRVKASILVARQTLLFINMKPTSASRNPVYSLRTYVRTIAWTRERSRADI